MPKNLAAILPKISKEDKGWAVFALKWSKPTKEKYLKLWAGIVPMEAPIQLLMFVDREDLIEALNYECKAFYYTEIVRVKERLLKLLDCENEK